MLYLCYVVKLNIVTNTIYKGRALLFTYSHEMESGLKSGMQPCMRPGMRTRKGLDMGTRSEPELGLWMRSDQTSRRILNWANYLFPSCSWYLPKHRPSFGHAIYFYLTKSTIPSKSQLRFQSQKNFSNVRLQLKYFQAHLCFVLFFIRFPDFAP